MEKELLKCGICGKDFSCKEHKYINKMDGKELSVPHCEKCYYDGGKCPDGHGYQCPDCEKKFPF